MGTSRTHINKVNWLRNKLVAFFEGHRDEIISKRKLLSAFALDNSSTVRTGREILAMFEDAGYINIYGDDITNGRKVFKP
jgi:hypothetical protein